MANGRHRRPRPRDLGPLQWAVLLYHLLEPPPVEKARKIRRLHAGLALWWAAMLPIVVKWEGLGNSVIFVSFLSVYALMVSHAAAWAGQSATLAAEQAREEAHQMHGDKYYGGENY